MTAAELTDAILHVRAEFLRDGNASCVEAINHGLCADFADEVWRRLGCPEPLVFADDELGSDGYRHTLLVHEGRYYDAEAPEGVDHWSSLPVYRRAYQPWDWFFGPGKTA